MTSPTDLLFAEYRRACLARKDSNLHSKEWEKHAAAAGAYLNAITIVEGIGILDVINDERARLEYRPAET